MDYRKLLREEREKARTAKAGEVKSAHSVELLSTQCECDNPEEQNRAVNQKIESAYRSDHASKSELNFKPFNVNDFCIGDVPNIYYVPDIIDCGSEFKLLESISFASTVKSKAWIQLKNRRLQSWGKNITKDADNDELLPPWLEDISRALVQSDVFVMSDLPNHVLINEYMMGDGIIHHTDGPIYRDVVAILSLGSPCLMTFKHKLESCDVGESNNGNIFSVMLQPRSLLIFSDTIYSQFMHGIDCSTSDVVGASAPCLNMALANVVEGQEIFRGKRTSLTLRKVLDTN